MHSYVDDDAFVWLRGSTSDSLVVSFTRYLPRSLLATLTFHVWDNSGFDLLEVAERTLYLSQLANNAATGMPRSPVPRPSRRR